jgi:hypothetical protein
MYSVVRIFEGDTYATTVDPEVGRARLGELWAAPGFVTLVAIKGDDGALVTVEIFETIADLRIAEADARRADLLRGPGDRPVRARTISGEIVFQRGL